jgi:hypothetical protein
LPAFVSTWTKRTAAPGDAIVPCGAVSASASSGATTATTAFELIGNGTPPGSVALPPATFRIDVPASGPASAESGEIATSDAATHAAIDAKRTRNAPRRARKHEAAPIARRVRGTLGPPVVALRPFQSFMSLKPDAPHAGRGEPA